MEDVHITSITDRMSVNASDGNNEANHEKVELNINKDIEQLNFKSIKDMVLINEDLYSALSDLPDFGFNNFDDIQRAQKMVNELRMMLEYYVFTENKYRETFGSLLKFLEDAGVVHCVDDLITVRKNGRKKDEGFLLKENVA